MKGKTLILVFAVFAPLLIAVRIYQVYTIIDPETGFYNVSDLSVTVLNAALAVSLLLMLSPLVMWRGKKDLCAADALTVRSVGGAGIVSALGASFFANGSMTFLRLASGRVEGGDVIVAIFALLSCFFFFLLLGVMISGRAPRSGMGGAALLPVFWAIVRLVVSFMGFTTIASISEYVFDILAMVSTLLFLYSQAKTLSGRDDPRGMAAFGFAGATLNALSAFPYLFALLAGNAPSGLVSSFDSQKLLDLLLAVYMVFAAARISVCGPRSSRTEDKTASAAES